MNITVKELPAGAPASFTGAVGKFSMEASLSADQLAANSAGTFTVKITGQGNLPFIQAPKLTLPASFEQYNVKTTESIQTANIRSSRAPKGRTVSIRFFSPTSIPTAGNM